MMLRAIMLALFAGALALVGTSAADAAQVAVFHVKVADYAKWRPGFDADKTNQEAAGLTSPHVYQSVTNPNDLTIMFAMADLAKAKAFSSSKALKEAMAKSGVVGKPTVKYLNDAQ